MSVNDQIRNMLTRVRMDSIDDSGGQQRTVLSGMAGQKMGFVDDGVVRVQNFGFTSVPPVGSEGIAMSLGGNPDQALVIGLEDVTSRVSGLPGGTSAIYNQYGDVIKLLQKEVEMTTETFTIKATTVVIESGDVNLGGLGGKPVAVEGTVDVAGHPLVSNFASNVKAV